MDWNRLEDFTYVERSSCDIVIGSDVLYQSRNAVPVFSVVNCFLKEGGLAIFFDPGRGYASFLEREATKPIPDKEDPAKFTPSNCTSELFELSNVKLTHCIMPELHIVVIRNGKLEPKAEQIYASLKNFIACH